MTVIVGNFSFNRLTAQPFGYQSTDTSAGLSVKSWSVSGLATPAEWLNLLNVYDNWRNLKIAEDPAVETGVIGATVSLSINGAGGQSWSNVACWFQNPPEGQQQGVYIAVNFVLVDAAEALQVAIKQEEAGSQEDELDLGTYILAGVTLKLRKQPDSYTFGPTLELGATGSHYLTGPLDVTQVKTIEGETNASGWSTIRAWYENIVQSTPASNTYFPIAPPQAEAENKIINGVKSLIYVVSVDLALVK